MQKTLYSTKGESSTLPKKNLFRNEHMKLGFVKFSSYFTDF